MVDPLQLDLHLPPGGGNVPWDQLRAALISHEAPLMMEIHPAHRSVPSALWEAAMSGHRRNRAHAARVQPGTLGGAGTASVPGARGLSRARHCFELI